MFFFSNLNHSIKYLEFQNINSLNRDDFKQTFKIINKSSVVYNIKLNLNLEFYTSNLNKLSNLLNLISLNTKLILILNLEDDNYENCIIEGSKFKDFINKIYNLISNNYNYLLKYVPL